MSHLWTGADPAPFTADLTDYELGTRITVVSTITIRQARVYSPGATYPGRVFRVWNYTTGVVVRSEAISDTLAPGWNLFTLATPLVLAPGEYMLSVPVAGGYGLASVPGPLSSGDGAVQQAQNRVGYFSEDPGAMPLSQGSNPVFYGIDAEWDYGNTTVGDQPPTVTLAADHNTGLTPLTVTLTTTATDESVGTLTYLFDFGDGSNPVTTTGSASHTYTTPGLYTATVRATDEGGKTAYAAVPVLAEAPLGSGLYEGAEQVLVTTWVRARLAQYAAQLDAIDPGLSGRVFDDFAPAGFAVYPFIIVQCQSPPRDVRGVGVSRVMVDTLYIVKAVAQTPSYDPLAPVARVIDAALTSATGGPVGSGDVFTSVRQEQFAMVEIDAGKQYRHFGGLFKIQAQG